MKQLEQNINTILMAGGFALFEVGASAQWSVAVAAMVGGVLVMSLGAWPYVVQTMRKRQH